MEAKAIPSEDSPRRFLSREEFTRCAQRDCFKPQNRVPGVKLFKPATATAAKPSALSNIVAQSRAAGRLPPPSTARVSEAAEVAEGPKLFVPRTARIDEDKSDDKQPFEDGDDEKLFLDRDTRSSNKKASVDYAQFQVMVDDRYFDPTDDYRKFVESPMVSVVTASRKNSAVEEDDKSVYSNGGQPQEETQWVEVKKRAEIQLDLFHQITFQDLEACVEELRTALPIGKADRMGAGRKPKWGMTSSRGMESRNVFTGSDLVSWLLSNVGERLSLKNRTMAESLGVVLVECGFIGRLKSADGFMDDTRLYQLVGSPDYRILNGPSTVKDTSSPSLYSGNGRDPQEIIIKALQKLQGLCRELFNRRIFSLSAIPLNFQDRYQQFLDIVYRLNDCSLAELRAHEEKLAFFLNLYNLLYLHALVELGVPKQPGDGNAGHGRIKLSRRAAYIVDGQRYTLMDVKYGILRAQMPLPNLNTRERQFLFPPKFVGNDPRRKHCLELADSRLNFATCNLTRSGSRLRIYQAKSVSQDLDYAVREYIRDHMKMECKGDTYNPVLHVTLPKLFEWYRGDFGKTNENILIWIADHHWDWIIKSKLADFTYARSVVVTFSDYDWTSDLTVALVANQLLPAES